MPSPRHWLCRSCKWSQKNGAVRAGWAGGATASPMLKVHRLPIVTGCMLQAGHIHLPHFPAPLPVQVFPQLHFLISTSHRPPLEIQHILVKMIYCPVVIIPDTVCHHHLHMGFSSSFWQLKRPLLTIQVIQMLSLVGIVAAVGPRALSVELPNSFLKVSLLNTFLVSVKIDGHKVPLFC